MNLAVFITFAKSYNFGNSLVNQAEPWCFFHSAKTLLYFRETNWKLWISLLDFGYSDFKCVRGLCCDYKYLSFFILLILWIFCLLSEIHRRRSTKSMENIFEYQSHECNNETNINTTTDGRLYMYMLSKYIPEIIEIAGWNISNGRHFLRVPSAFLHATPTIQWNTFTRYWMPRFFILYSSLRLLYRKGDALHSRDFSHVSMNQLLPLKTFTKLGNNANTLLIAWMIYCI